MFMGHHYTWLFLNSAHVDLGPHVPPILC